MLWLKIIAALSCAFAALLWAGAASAQDRVLLMDSPASPRASLAAALRIELVDSAVVQVVSELPDGSVSERIAVATALGERNDALLVVWSDDPMAQADGSSEVVLYAVSRQEGRALLQVVRVPGGTGPEVDRALALKIHEAIGDLQRMHELAPELAAMQLEQGAQGDQRTLGAVFSLGLLVGPQPGTDLGQWGAALGGGVELRELTFRTSALLQLAWFAPVTATRAGDSVQLDTLSPELIIRSQWRQGPVWLGAHVGAGFSSFDLSARTASGTNGDAQANSITVLAGLNLELPLSPHLAMCLAAELEARAVSRRFRVNADEITSVERLRPRVALGLSLRP